MDKARSHVTPHTPKVLSFPHGKATQGQNMFFVLSPLQKVTLQTPSTCSSVQICQLERENSQGALRWAMMSSDALIAKYRELSLASKVYDQCDLNVVSWLRRSKLSLTLTAWAHCDHPLMCTHSADPTSQVAGWYVVASMQSNCSCKETTAASNCHMVLRSSS